MRKTLLLLPLLCAYALILGHNLIPHVHHDHNHDSHLHVNEAPSPSHHDSDHGGKDKNGESLNDLFGHILHSPFTNALEHTLTVADDNKALKPIASALLITQMCPDTYSCVPEIKRVPDPPDRNYAVHFSPDSPLRAPPLV